MAYVNLANYDTDLNNFQNRLMAIIHEMSHALGFTPALYSLYVDPNTGLNLPQQ
jgi:Zn-dependent M32 family carboxypeptidase